MPHYAAFHLGFHMHIGVISIQGLNAKVHVTSRAGSKKIWSEYSLHL